MSCLIFNRHRRRTSTASTPLPILISIALGYGPTAGGSEVILRGSGFTGASSVTIGGVACTSVVVDSDTQITCDTPAGSAGAKDVVVTTPAGTSTLAGGYTFQAGPDLSGATLDVTTGAHYGGDLVTVTGASRIEDGCTLTLGGVAHSVTKVSSTSFIFITKAIAVGSVGAKNLTVTNPDGQSGTKNSAFTYYAGNGAKFVSGAAMDAAAVVGRRYELIGATTGAVIASLECVTTGPVTYRLLGVVRLFEADGTEFDGVFKPAAVGSGSAPTWGVAGSRTTGGAQFSGTGTYEWQGLVAPSTWHLHILAAVYIDAAPASPAQYDALWVGFHRAANTSIDGGGVSRNGTNNWVASTATNLSRDLPASGTGITLGATVTLTVDVEWEIGGQMYKNGANITRLSFLQRSSTTLAPGSNNAASDADGRTFAFGVRGAWTARVVEWGVNQGRAQ